MLLLKTAATGEFSKLSAPNSAAIAPEGEKESRADRERGWSVNLGTHAKVNHRTGRKTKAASVPHTKFSEAQEPLLRPQNDARAGERASGGCKGGSPRAGV